MKFFLRVLPVLLAVCSLAPAYSMAADIDTVVSKLQARYETIDTLSADFTQEVYSIAAGRVERSGGRVHLKKPAMMRWRYLSGIDDELVSDGKFLWLFQPELNQVVESRGGQGSGIALDFLSGVGDIKENFKVDFVKEDGAKEGPDTYQLVLYPSEASANLKRLLLGVDKSTGLVLKTVVEDHFGNSTTVTFSGIKINIPIKDSFFKFTPPAGVNVLRR